MKVTTEKFKLVSRANLKINKIYFCAAMLFIYSYSNKVYGQMFISPGTVFSGSGDGQLTLDSSLINQGEMTLQNQFAITLNGAGSIMTAQELNVPKFVMNGTVYELDGMVNVNDSLQLQNGMITPLPSSRLTVENVGVATSENQAHIDGKLYLEGQGEKFFPIGVNGTYTPVIFENVIGDSFVLIGLSAFNFDLGLNDVLANVKPSIDWHWMMEVEGEFEGSTVRLPFLPEDQELIENHVGKPIVIHSDGPGLESVNLDSEFMEGDTVIVSLSAANKSFLLVGSALEIDPVIHNIITINGDEDNSFLIIENIDALEGNEVSLIDRWGNKVFSKKNFKNFNDSDNLYNGEFDFLPSGNYVCLLKYGSETKSQMVTLIKE